MSRRRAAPVTAILLVAAACLVAYGAGVAVRVAAGLRPAVAWADEPPATPPAEATTSDPAPPLEAVAELQIVDGEEQGRIRVGDRQVLEIESMAGGLTGYERCLIVAKRLNDAFAASIGPDQVQSVVSNGLHVVTIAGRTLVTASPEEANRHHVTEAQLADGWAASVIEAMGGQVPAALMGDGSTPPSGEQFGPEYTPTEPSRDKIVPVLSILDGGKLGVARVTGPVSAVDQVKAVVQLETDFRKVLGISVYVPINTEQLGDNLGRVQGAGVTGLADIRVIR